MAISAPPATKFVMRLTTLPTTLDPASSSWLELPWRARMISASVWARGATWRMRRPKG